MRAANRSASSGSAMTSPIALRARTRTGAWCDSLLAQRIGRIGSWEYEVATGTYLCSEEANRILGDAPGTVEPAFEAFVGRVIPGDRARVTTVYEERMRSGVGFQMDFRILRVDGRLLTVRGSVEFERDCDGRLERVLGTIRDATVAEVVTGNLSICRRCSECGRRPHCPRAIALRGPSRSDAR